MFSTTSAEAAFSSAASDIGVIIGIAVLAILGAWAALIGLGWAIRKVTKHVTGRKF